MKRSLLGRTFVILLATFFLLSIASCAGRPSSLIASTSPIPAGIRGTVPAYGSDCQYLLLGILPLTSSPNTQGALIEAKADAGVDVLTDVTVDENSGYYILFSNRCVRVQGLGVNREVLERALNHSEDIPLGDE